ncbi:SDR family NAD(P)-dependent oxidoreductase, partial [Glaesserella parasuis]|uniref:SDR family NAD(P)-dependent oxidoreductase n=1 Tax=Glaesserella parasuis TaxID=738 RepID=UPI003B7BE5A0
TVAIRPRAIVGPNDTVLLPRILRAAGRGRFPLPGGGEALIEPTDVRDAAAIAPLVRRCAERLGGLDGLVLNVGISRALPLDRQTAADWDEEYAVNVRSHMLFSQAALELMAPGSAIVLMSSLAAVRNSGRNPAYESS